MQRLIPGLRCSLWDRQHEYGLHEAESVSGLRNWRKGPNEPPKSRSASPRDGKVTRGGDRSDGLGAQSFRCRALGLTWAGFPQFPGIWAGC